MMKRILQGILGVGLIGVFGFAAYRLWHAVHGEVQANPHIDIQSVYREHNVIPVAIVGSGPAGFSAAMYAARGAYHTVVFEGDLPGGQLMTTTWVENWPGIHKQYGPDIMGKAREQAKAFGARTSSDVVTEVDTHTWPYTLTTSSGKQLHALSIIWATGATPRTLGVPGEQAYWGNGVTTCAVCDAPFHKNDRVCVVGGGDSAVEEALELAPYAREIIIMVRRDTMRASPIMQKQLQAYDHIQIWFNTQISEIYGDGSQVTGVRVTRDGDEQDVSLSGVFLAIGHDPNTNLLADAVAIDQRGYILVEGRSQRTTCPGIYAAGDVEDATYKQAGVAAGDGIKAALDAAEFLRDIGYNEHVQEDIADALYDPDIEAQRAPLSELTDVDMYAAYVLQSDKPVIIDCYRDYCPSCEAMMPHMEYIAARFDQDITCYKLHTQRSPALAQTLGIASKPVPRILVYRDGQLVEEIPHALSRAELVKLAQRISQ